MLLQVVHAPKSCRVDFTKHDDWQRKKNHSELYIVTLMHPNVYWSLLLFLAQNLSDRSETSHHHVTLGGDQSSHNFITTKQKSLTIWNFSPPTRSDFKKREREKRSEPGSETLLQHSPIKTSGIVYHFSPQLVNSAYFTAAFNLCPVSKKMNRSLQSVIITRLNQLSSRSQKNISP